MCERRMSGFESFCVYMCVLALRHSHAHRQLPSFASACRFGLSGCTLSKSVCEPRVCVCVLAVGGEEGGCKDIKNGKKTFFFLFSFHLCASATVPASVPSAMGTKTTVTTHSFP